MSKLRYTTGRFLNGTRTILHVNVISYTVKQSPAVNGQFKTLSTLFTCYFDSTWSAVSPSLSHCISLWFYNK